MKKNNLTLLLLLSGSFLVSSCEEPDDSLSLHKGNNPSLVENNSSHANSPGVPTSATVRFGDENAGSPFPPQEEHDQSIHATDKMVPRTVVIAQGGEVTYEVHPFHQVAIYAPGTHPDDIDLSPAALEDLVLPFPPFLLEDFIINDPTNRVALSPPLALTETSWTTPAGTFDAPGRYLVICTTFPHFVAADMFGWVIVK